MSPHSCSLFVPFNSESGRTDVMNAINDFVFTPASKSAFENFTIVDDSVLEFDELLIAEFNFGPEISTNWKSIKGWPSIAFILIRDDDCELCSKSTMPQQLIHTIYIYYSIVQCPNLFVQYFSLLIMLPSGNSLLLILLNSLAVEVNFNEPSYTAAESDRKVSISLCITGQFYVPLWVIVEINDGTATGGLCKLYIICYNRLCIQTLHKAHDYNLCTYHHSEIVHSSTSILPLWLPVSVDAEDYSTAMRHNVTFRQTAFADVGDPTPTALSSPILINITCDDIFEGVEYFQARIVETSDSFRVRVGQNTISVTIYDGESFINLCFPEFICR